MKFIKVTLMTGSQIYLNAAHIACITAIDGEVGSKLFEHGENDDHWTVRETPEQIVNMAMTDHVFVDLK